MKKVYLDNNIFSKLINDKKFEEGFRNLYPKGKFELYISLGTLSEQYKGKLYSREKILNSGVKLLLNHEDVAKFERSNEKDFWENKKIRLQSMEEFYNGLLVLKFRQLQSQGIFEQMLFLRTEMELRDEIESEYFNGINNQSKDLLLKFRNDAKQYKLKSIEHAKKIKNHPNQAFVKNTYTNQGKIKPKDIVVLQSISMGKESMYKGIFTMSVLKQHRIATLDKELGLNDLYDVIQGFWYPYMDEIIIERKQSMYLKEMRIKDPLKSHLKNLKISNIKELNKRLEELEQNV